MKKDIHPTYYEDAKVTCVCGNTFNVGSTKPNINVEICSKCHPFFTGEMKFIDTQGRIEKFQAKQEAAKNSSFKKKTKNKESKESHPKSLKSMLGK